ncbi:hypothetical protein NCC78_26830, partial [Micromonospora phytophila]|nr:hypothetical protein [Micromonospora phytophila]
MSEPGEDPGAPLLARHRSPGDYRRVVGVHRAPGAGGPSRGYLFTVALLAGTASMPILAAISTGSATVGSTALPDTSTPFLPTPSVGPVVIPLPVTGQPSLTRSPAVPAAPTIWRPLAPARRTPAPAVRPA